MLEKNCENQQALHQSHIKRRETIDLHGGRGLPPYAPSSKYIGFDATIIQLNKFD